MARANPAPLSFRSTIDPEPAVGCVRRWLAGISAILAYLVVDFAAGVILIRSASPAIVLDDQLHHRLVPGMSSSINTPEYRYVQRVNELGIRGPDIDPRKADGVFRVLTLGDSFTMGEGVSDTETFSVLLEENLNERASGVAGPRVEVLNAGVDSYAPILSRLQLLDLAPRLSPDLVILNLDISDLLQEQAYRSRAVRDSDGSIVAVREPHSFASSTRGYINRHLVLTRAALAYLDPWGGGSGPNVYTLVELASTDLLRYTLAGDTVNREQQWNDIFESILGIDLLCRERGMSFVLAIYPWGHQVSDQEWPAGRARFLQADAVVSDDAMRRIESFARENGVRLANLYPVFRDYKGGERLYYDVDMHWTPEGHRVAAEGLEAAVRDLVAWR